MNPSNPFTGRRSLGVRWTLSLALALTAGLVACNTDKLLEVNLPGRVSEEALDDPRLAQTLTNSVIADVECSWDNYVAAAAHHSDEWMASSGNSTMARWGLRDIPPSFESMATGGCGTSYGLFTPLHGARFQAESNYDRIAGFPDADVPNKTALLATIRAYGAWPLIAFSEGFCGTPLDGADEVLGPRAGRPGRAEVHRSHRPGWTGGARRPPQPGPGGAGPGATDPGKLPGVLADAAQIPEGFKFVATRDNQPGDRQNAHYDAINGLASDAAGQKHATISPNFRDLQWKGVEDPRVNVEWDGTLGFDFFTKHYRHDKVNSSRPHHHGVVGGSPALHGRGLRHDRPAGPGPGHPPDDARASGHSGGDGGGHPHQGRRHPAPDPGAVAEFSPKAATASGTTSVGEAPPTRCRSLGSPARSIPTGLLDAETGEPLREYEDGTCFPVPLVEQT